MKIALRLLTLAMALFTTACTQASFGIVNAPSYFDGTKTHRNIPFGSHGQSLDIYIPAKSAAPHPVVLFFYGGRWTDGEKGQYKFVGSALAKRGYIVVVPDYRKYPDVKFPAFVQDGAAALAWVHGNIARYGGDTGNIHLSGHSAGAHIAALIATDQAYLAAEKLDRSIIKSFTGLAGPYDFTPEDADLKDMFGPPDAYPQMRATTFTDGRQPPMLLLWGADDTTVGQFNMDRLAAAIHDKGGCVVTKTYPGLDHVWIIGSLSWLGKKSGPVLNDWTGFMHNPCGK